MDCVLVSLEVTTPDNVTVLYEIQAGNPVPGPGLPEAPLDGKTYGRRSGAWADVGAASLPSGGQPGEVLRKLSSADGDADWGNIDDGVY